MILGNRGYNAYDVNKKNERGSARMEESNGIAGREQLMISIGHIGIDNHFWCDQLLQVRRLMMSRVLDIDNFDGKPDMNKI